MTYRGEMIGLDAILFAQRSHDRHGAGGGQLPVRWELDRAIGTLSVCPSTRT